MLWSAVCTGIATSGHFFYFLLLAYLSFFFLFNYVYMCISVSGFVHMTALPAGDQKRESEFLKAGVWQL